ncbi:hypothetical protein CAC42_6015 [Sphaceloma murrayae]|uniref:Uncharacterized protein n=1 Tax=Sphaceloma murrayae TaxID=2082308 RepID=A0A2K1QVE3_9PEZI|nr:hypothetical protein CAC42_6015 [Sphaceloma murrayae]
MTTYTPESHLLAPVSPTINPDDWPIFTLSSATVTSSTAVPVSLLTADVHHPLTIRGRLPAIPRALSHHRLQPGGAEDIEIRDVRQYAYGQYDDGRVEIWAAGKAGWFTVRPGKTYRVVYEGMVEAIEVLYFAADAYSQLNETKRRKGKRRRGEVSAEEVFAGYAAANGLRGEEEAREVFEKRRGFLIKSMLLGKEGVEWERTGLWQWFVESFEDDVEEARRDIATAQRHTDGKVKGVKRKRESVQPADDTSTAGSSRARKPRRSHVKSEPSTPHTETPFDSDEGERSGKRPKGHKGKSVLRPKANHFAIEAEEPEDDDSMADFQTIRLRVDLEQELPHVPPTRLTASTMTNSRKSGQEEAMPGAAVVDEGIDMGLDNSGDENSEESDGDVISRSKIDQMPVRLREEHTVATGEGDIWSCPLDGCMQKVYAASEAASQKLIKEHYRMHVHDEDSEMRMELVRRMEAPGQPVSRLMRKIQETGRLGVQPITRRY